MSGRITRGVCGHQRVGLGAVTSFTEYKQNLPALPRFECDLHLQRRTRIEAWAAIPRQPHMPQRSRLAHIAVPPEERAPVACPRHHRLGACDKRHAVGKVAIKRIVCVQRTGTPVG